MNSSFTAANRFQLAKPVSRTNGGISEPISTGGAPGEASSEESGGWAMGRSV